MMLSIKLKKTQTWARNLTELWSVFLVSLPGTNEVLCIIRDQNSKAKIQKDKITVMVEVIEARQQII